MMFHTCDILQEANENGGKFKKIKKKRMHCKSAYCKNAWKKKEIKAKYENVWKPLFYMFSGHLHAQYCIC